MGIFSRRKRGGESTRNSELEIGQNPEQNSAGDAVATPPSVEVEAGVYHNPNFEFEDYQSLKKAIESLKQRYDLVKDIERKQEQRFEQLNNKLGEAMDLALRNQNSIDELKSRVDVISENLSNTSGAMLSSFEKLKEIVLELNNRLCQLNKDFYEITDKDAFNEFKKEIIEEKEGFRNEVRLINEQINKFRKQLSRQGVTRRDIDDLLYKFKYLDQNLRRVLRTVDGFAGELNDLKDKDRKLELNIRKGLNVLREELSLDEDAINRLIIRNKEFVRLKQEFVDLERRYKIFEKQLKDLGDDDLSMRDFMQKEFRTLRSELGIVRTKVLEALKRDEQLQKRVERLAPLKLDRELDSYKRANRELQREFGEMRVDFDHLKKVANMAIKEVDLLSSRLSEVNKTLPNLVSNESLRQIVNEINQRLSQLNTYIRSFDNLQNQLEQLRSYVYSTLDRFDRFNKRMVDKLVDLETKGSSSDDISRLREELRLLEEARSRLAALPTSAPTTSEQQSSTPTTPPAEAHVFKWIEENLNKGYTPKELKNVLRDNNMDPALVDQYFASQ
ncbi:hypothetical protein DRJ48_00760 [Candidatus Woesearchaeota archaeon]|nr:MAG: hypothetical protein DRJ48_00760 [Candidatus Woesearchaeota archaeon]